ncbi:hypothetical protein NDU88_004241 [Pleurodeles waltl]|uniref:Uncharacterized protein n=1 Tax=Pleurodeles waltl TaxID=8319 RepID=A0AAV7W621_PLEWA|nr:hypothetical protein NDU88_004241 [Pleurodeles waltl]
MHRATVSGTVSNPPPSLHWLHVSKIALQRPLITRCSCGGCDLAHDPGTSKWRLHSTRCSCRSCGSLPQITILFAAPPSWLPGSSLTTKQVKDSAH